MDTGDRKTSDQTPDVPTVRSAETQSDAAEPMQNYGNIWKWRAIAAIPVVALICGVYVSAHSMRLSVLKWGNIEIVKPVETVGAYQDTGVVIYQVHQQTVVRAGITGTVVQAQAKDGVVVVQSSQADVTLKYSGLATVSVAPGEGVNRGQTIGNIQPGSPDASVGTLRVALLENGKEVPPPRDIPQFYSSLGQKVYMTDCAGCHLARRVIPLEGGRLRGGAQATEQAIEAKIRVGGKASGDGLSMPPFEGALTKDEIKAVAEFVCQHRCSQFVAQSGPKPH